MLKLFVESDLSKTRDEEAPANYLWKDCYIMQEFKTLMPSDITMGQVVAQDPVSMGRATMELPVQVSIREVITTRIIRAVKEVTTSSSSSSRVIRAIQNS